MSHAFLYKCRLCGEIAENPHVGGNEIVAFQHLLKAIMGLPADLQGPTMLSTHRCKDGRTGVTDFIGFQKDKD